MRGKRLGSLVAVVLLLATLTGCTSFGADVESNLRPPQATGEQGRIETALREYIASTLTQENYVLKYPQSGAHRSAFVVEDLDGDGNADALAFYRLGTENGTTHVNLLRQSGGKWESVSDFESSGTDIECVTFGDMNGDGVQEVFICWDMYSSRTYQLSMYMLTGNRIAESFTSNCAQVTVGALTGSGRDNCLLFNVVSGNLTATLWEMRDGVMEELGQAVVATTGSGEKLRVANVVPLSAEKNGVLLDYGQSAEFMSTTLIYWDGSRLVMPLDPHSDQPGMQNGRPVTIPSGDVDEDGAWEWPTCTRLPGYENDTGDLTATVKWKTTFWSWDAALEKPVEKFSCVYNSADGYYLLTDNLFSGEFTTSYNESFRTLWVYPVADGKAGDPLLAVRTVPNGAEVEEEDSERRFRPLVTGESAEYAVWFEEEDVYSLNMEKLQYLLTLL